MVLAVAVSAKEEGLDGLIDDIKQMQQALQDEHEADAKSYEEVACHCHDETKRLADEIGQEVSDIHTASGKIKAATATKEEMEKTIQQSLEDRAARKEAEQERKEAFKERAKSLAADIAEASQAVNALEAALGYFTDPAHEPIKKLIDDMLLSVKEDLTEHTTNLEKAKETDRNEFKNWKEKDGDLLQLIRESKGTKQAAEETLGEFSEELLESEKAVKPLYQQLQDLEKYCTKQANDWDHFSSERKTDYGVFGMAVNILSCGNTKCEKKGMFLQTNINESVESQKLALRQFFRENENTTSPALIQFRNAVRAAEDPLKEAKNLLRKLMQNLISENEEDIKEMGTCVATVMECKTQRKHAFENMTKAKSELEKLGSRIAENKVSFEKEANNWAKETNNQNDHQDDFIPDAITQFENELERLHDTHGKLEAAIDHLRKHFGNVARDALLQADKPKRKTGQAGSTQSNGVMIVKMLENRLGRVNGQIATLRADHEDNLQTLRDRRTASAASAARSEAKMKMLKADIEEDTANFQDALEELAGYTSVAGANAHCVQTHEPCGVATDAREKREAEVASLKKAYEILGGDPADLD